MEPVGMQASGNWLPDHVHVIALVCERGGEDWASGVAVGLADMVGRERGRTFLANVASCGRELDDMLAAGAGPGLTSALTGVASIASVARSSAEQRFAYLPAGDGALPYSGLRRMQAFRRFLEKVKQGGGTLLLFVGEDDLTAPPPAGSARPTEPLALDGCIGLGDARGLAAAAGAPLLARVERPAPPPTEPHSAEAATTAPLSDSDAPEGPGKDVRRQRRTRARPLGSLSRIAVPLAALLVVWLVLALRSDPATASHDDAARSESTAGAGDAIGERAVPPRAEAAEAPTEEGPRTWAAPAATYSVLVGSYIRLADAMGRRAELAADGGFFFVSPTPVRGRIYYRVLAGVYEDRADAASAMASLVADGRKEALKEWDIRPVRLAYDMGTFADRAAAERRRDELLRSEVPAYMLSDTAEVPWYRVFAGAFRIEADGVPLGQRLAELGAGGELINRSGVAP